MIEQTVISRTLVQRVLGVLLLFSALLYLLMLIIQMPELQQTSAGLINEDNAGWSFTISIATTIVFVFSRLVLGYIVYLNKPLAHWLFFSLCLLTLISGGMGFVLAIAALMVRFWPDNDIKNSNAD
ncbi:hypothetical protein VT06_01065 [Arsukibacterium sp. MJ3]|jgi:uncharacterized membrane protein|uniref:hypothetical protein n=1 Tax=Arsukibacterium sp. MJ3 TaxID=1632859 RepID=UPI000626F8DE|nr:hypothetical protein [Arsukibacterium sp. MJ3]KKO50597.1 hypothetical protein VT06_01065 [Arsukibacterium sp. MJ3]